MTGTGKFMDADGKHIFNAYIPAYSETSAPQVIQMESRTFIYQGSKSNLHEYRETSAIKVSIDAIIPYQTR